MMSFKTVDMFVLFVFLQTSARSQPSPAAAFAVDTFLSRQQLAAADISRI